MAKCPHCEKPVTLEKSDANQIRREESGWFIKKEWMYSCPHCDKVLGFSVTIT